MRNGPKPDLSQTVQPEARPASSMTDIERKILDYMVIYLRTNTYQPSIREIGEQFGIKSTKTVSEHLQALADKGFLERDPSRSRGVRILGVDLNAQTVSVPLYRDLPEVENGFRTDGADTYFSLDRRMAAGKGCFMVQAPGDRLAAVGVTEGDYLVVEPVLAEELEDGDVLAIRLSSKSKSDYYRLRKTDSKIFLHPMRADADPIAIEELASLGMVGRVSALYRRMSALPSAVTITTH